MGYLQDMLAHGEEIVYTTRQHWLFIAPTLALYVLIAGVIIAASVIINAYTGNPLALLILILLVYPIYRFLEALLRWYNLCFIVTDRRVIEIRGTIRKMVSDSSLDKVNDVILTQSVLGRIMNWGDIKILTASEAGVNIMRRIANPLGFKRAMLDQREGWTQSRRAALDDDETLLLSLERLHQRGLISDAEYEEKRGRLAQGRK